MTELNESAPEADQEVVAEAENEEPEAVETEGQEQDPPAKDDGDEPEAEDDKPSESKLRRERRKAAKERLYKEAEEARAEAERVKARLARIEQVSQSSAAPKEADFGSYEEYQAALAGYHSLRMLDERQRGEATQEVEAHQERLSKTEAARQQELQANWKDQLTEATQKYTDFAKVFTDDLPVSRETAEMLMDSDVGADIAYYLGTNRKEAAQIATLPPLEQARRIGAIEARLSLPQPNTTTKAPAPINPVKGKGGASKAPSDMSPNEYRAWRESGGKL